MDEDFSLYGDIGDLRDRHGEAGRNRDHPGYPNFLAELDSFAEAGHAHAAEALGDELATRGPHYSPELPYKWYYIGLSQRGYSVGWDDQNRTPVLLGSD